MGACKCDWWLPSGIFSYVFTCLSPYVVACLQVFTFPHWTTSQEPYGLISLEKDGFLDYPRIQGKKLTQMGTNEHLELKLFIDVKICYLPQLHMHCLNY